MNSGSDFLVSYELGYTCVIPQCSWTRHLNFSKRIDSCIIVSNRKCGMPLGYMNQKITRVKDAMHISDVVCSLHPSSLELAHLLRGLLDVQRDALGLFVIEEASVVVDATVTQAVEFAGNFFAVNVFV